jgi:hypothetical protein
MSEHDQTPTPPTVPMQPSIDDAPPKQTRRTLFIVLGGIAATVCLCVAIAALLIGQGVLRVTQEQAAITPVLDRFMQAMTRRDVNSAYQLFSSRAQRQTSLADLGQLVEGPNYLIFDGYQSVALDNTNLTNSINTNPDVPQGTIATVTGRVMYEGDVTGSLRATLEKEDGEWRLFAFNITVPPSKTLP